MLDRLRIGILGAARIAPTALIAPSRQIPEVDIVAIAARDPQHAASFARKHQIPRVFSSYDEICADPDLNAVYIPLPNSLHCRWAIKALEAGKHVLCEKPSAANADEAARMAQAAQQADKVLMEAFHYRYHPLAARMKEIVDNDTLGVIRRIDVSMCVPLPLPGDIRYRYDLAGGATMDIGAYAVHMLRLLGGDDLSVTRAQARLASPQVDRWMQADVRWADGKTGRMTCSLFSADLLHLAAHVYGERGELHVVNPLMPQAFSRLTLRTDKGKQVEHFPRISSYEYQLRAFVAAVCHGAPILTGPADAVINMQVIDAIYTQAGLLRRGQEMQ